MRWTPAQTLLVGIALSAFASPAVRTDGTTQMAGWITHNDPAGFAIDTPAAWNVALDAKQGRITILGQRGEQAVVWPMSIEQRQLDARGAAPLVLQLARKVDDHMPWGAANSSGNFVRAVARGSQRSGSAIMTWSPGENGTNVFLYCVEAPADVYGALTDTFVRILQSFRVVQDASGPNAGSRPPVTFVDWTDPREKAFTMTVPQGWQVIGGAYRLTATDIRNGVTMVSPDGQIRVVVGDSNLGAFTEPNQMLAYAGLREGQYQMLGDGTNLEIRRYFSGQQFARAYVQSYVQRQCSGPQIESNNARPDLGPIFLRAAHSEGMANPQLTVGDITFSCNLNGASVQGTFVVATIVPFPGQAQLWSVYRLYGYLASPERQRDAQEICQRAVQSWKINPEWQARERQIANAAVQQDNLRSQQIRARAMAAIQDDQRHISDTIVKGYEQRSKVYDEISRRQENAILGTVDVVDPETGKQYKIENYSDYHWMNNERTIAGNNTGTSPGPDWRELVTLP
jgi:hypothetical protein